MTHEKIFQLLIKNRIQQALDAILVLLNSFDEQLYIDLVILSANLHACNRAYDLKIISFDEWMKTRSQIIKAIIHILQEIPSPKVEDSG